MPTPQTPATQQTALAQAPFLARSERPLRAKPAGLCAGDFDGDGLTDLAATLVTPGALLIWRGNKTGLPRDFKDQACGDFPLPPLALPRGTFGAQKNAQAIAVCSRTTRELQIVTAGSHRIMLDETPRALAAGMIDGKVLIAAACDGLRLEVLRDGETEPQHWKLSAELPRCALVSGELSAVLVGFQDSTTVEAYTSADAAPIGRIQLPGFPRALAELDVDGDGDLELAVAGGDRELWIFGIGASGGARAWFTPQTPLTQTIDAIPLALAVADFDGDGRDDLAILHHYQLSVVLLTQWSATGAGRSTSIYAGQTPIGLAVLDADGDGKLDVAVANRDTLGLGLLLGDGAGKLGGSGIPLGDFPSALVAAPKSEGALRLVALNAKSNSISALVFADKKLSAWPGVDSGVEARAPAIAELDGKPGLDLLFLSSGPRGAQLVRLGGDPAGHFTPSSVLELPGAASELCLLDVDGDKKLELALCDPNAALLSLLENASLLGDVASLARCAHIAVPSSPRALCCIELDGDPAPELACVLGAPGERVGIAWLDARRNPSGELQLAELGFIAVPGAPLAAVSCDLNGDGKQDLAVLASSAPDSPSGAWYALLRGPNGVADFSLSAAIPTGMRPHRIAAADLDGDGRAEVFVAAQDSHLVNGWTSAGARGANPFSPRAWDDLGVGLGPLDLCLSDVDGDGLLDLCVVNGFSNDLSVLRGRRR